MSGKPLEDMKEGVGVFIDLIDQASDGTQNGQIGSGSHIGIESAFPIRLPLTCL